MAFLHRRGCEEPSLAQQVQQLLSDATLEDYAAAFSPGMQSWDGRPGVLSKSHHQIFTMLTVRRDQSALEPRPRRECEGVEIEKQSLSNDAAKDLSSSVAASPVLEGARGCNLQSPLPQVLDKGFNSEQVRKSQ